LSDVRGGHCGKPVNKPLRLFGASLIALGITLGVSMFLQMIGTVWVAVNLLSSTVSAEGVSSLVLAAQITAEIIFCTLAAFLVHYGWRIWKSS
jgi:hypothetical protein